MHLASDYIHPYKYARGHPARFVLHLSGDAWRSSIGAVSTKVAPTPTRMTDGGVPAIRV